MRGSFRQWRDIDTGQSWKERADLGRHRMVEVALGHHESGNTLRAIEFLKSHDFSAELIGRVLGEPQRRRPASVV